MKYIFTFAILFFATGLYAQQSPAGKRLVQFSGIITDKDSSFVVPYVTITNQSRNDQKFAANYKGFFSIVARPGDSLIYHAVGYADQLVVIPESVKDLSYTTMVKMKSEIVYLPAVRVYPWATIEDFTKDFMALKIADDDTEIARKNLSQNSINGMIEYLPRDAGEISTTNFRLDQERALNKNMVPTTPLLNPFAWGKLMEQIFSGDKSRQSDK